MLFSKPKLLTFFLIIFIFIATTGCKSKQEKIVLDVMEKYNTKKYWPHLLAKAKNFEILDSHPFQDTLFNKSTNRYETYNFVMFMLHGDVTITPAPGKQETRGACSIVAHAFAEDGSSVFFYTNVFECTPGKANAFEIAKMRDLGGWKKNNQAAK